MVLIVFCIAASLPAKAQAPTLEKPAPCPTDVRGMIDCYAERYGANVDELNLVINDESGFTCNPKGWNDGGRAFGVAQYHKGTFKNYAGKMGEPLDYYSCHDQIKLMAWQFANIPSSKCEWTLYKNLYCKKA